MAARVEKRQAKLRDRLEHIPPVGSVTEGKMFSEKILDVCLNLSETYQLAYGDPIPEYGMQFVAMFPDNNSSKNGLYLTYMKKLISAGLLKRLNMSFSEVMDMPRHRVDAMIAEAEDLKGLDDAASREMQRNLDNAMKEIEKLRAKAGLDK